MTELYIKLIAAVAPAIVLTILMIRRDKVRREPIGWLLGSAGLGVVAGLAVILIGLTESEALQIHGIIGAGCGTRDVRLPLLHYCS